MDFRQYDNAIGRFNGMDMLSELAYNHTPYRYGFNNPVFWSDPTGLFESYGAAENWIDTWGLNGAEIEYNIHKNVYQISNQGYTFYQMGTTIVIYTTTSGGVSINILKGGASGGGSGFGGGAGFGGGSGVRDILDFFNYYLADYYRGPASGIYGPYVPDGMGVSIGFSTFGSTFELNLVMDSYNNFYPTYSYSAAPGFNTAGISEYLPSFSATLDFYDKTHPSVDFSEGLLGKTLDVSLGYFIMIGQSRPYTAGLIKTSFGFGGGIRVGEGNTWPLKSIFFNQ